MKKYLLLSFLLISARLFAQVPEDALRYSWLSHNGSARYMAIGGVMGSLGGDITAAFVNPAGLGFYRTGEISITPSFHLNNNKSTFRDGPTNNFKKNVINLGTVGYVNGISLKDNPGTSSSFAIALNQLANFNNTIRYSALNNFSSFSEQFAEEFAKENAKYGTSIDDVLNTNSILPYTAAPALYTFLIDTVFDGSKYIVRGAPENILDAGQAVQQEMLRTTKGGLYELAFAFASNFKEKWFVGATVGLPIVDYKNKTIFTESDTSKVNNGFQSATFTDEFSTQGIGLNLKLGAIYRPQEYIRLGLAVHTPSLLYQTDRRTTNLVHNNDDTIYTIGSQTFTQDGPGKSSYIQSTPWKAILSASYVFREVQDVRKQRGFVSADIEYLNHRGTRFNVEEDSEENAGKKTYYKALNKSLKDQYRGTFNFRVGGELKFNILMARLGFAYYTNPYKDRTFKADKMLLSGGLGYRHKGFFVDLTYVHNVNKDVHFPYRLEDRENTFASIKQTQGIISATIGFKL